MTKHRTHLIILTSAVMALLLVACAGATTPLNTGKPAASNGTVILWEAPTIETVNIALPISGQWMGAHKSVETYWTMEQVMRNSFHYGPGGCDGG
jgi:hypothetical protein